MHLKSERGLTLLEVLISIIMITFIMVGGYKLLTTFFIEADIQMEETKDILGIDAYNRLFLEDIRYSTDIVYSENGEDITLFFTADEPKSLVYRHIYENTYSVDYITSKVKKENLLEIRVKSGVKPILYDDIESSLTLNHSIGGIEYAYKIYLRKE